MMSHALLLIMVTAVAPLFKPTAGQHAHENEFGCHCMEYWTCITSGGQPYSYCGLSASSVCCFVPFNAKPIGILPLAQRKKSCGRKGTSNRDDGQAEMSEWPWHAAILEQPQDLYVCGASLLDESWVLTAAHCVDDYLEKASNLQELLKVRLGEYDVSTTAEPLRHEEFAVSRIVIHPEFDNATLVNDIALLQLVRSARRKPNIDAVCMPKLNDFAEGSPTNCFVTGWGRRNEETEHSVVLKEISVPLWSNPACQNALREQFGPAYSLPTTALCAGAEGRDACDGDGGGPLVCEKEGHWYQVGVVSFGIGCGRRNIPGVYTRVQAFEGWIKDTIGVHHHP
ncbi:serine protease 29-like [Penaeus monodon]|uniref:serine protease 29-like n=1 Tax=Penaeus monodon TaxID=6687 RepID=UPI0018A7D254|nr:serine protease 29-like [Penaeus monodon]